MLIEWDVPIEMDDGIVLRADLFRPQHGGPHPVILTYGPYAKGLPFEVGYPAQWQRLIEDHPDVVRGSSARYQSWELPDPERWIPFGYACLRIDSRGAGRSPGLLDPLSPRETRDLYACIEWAGTAPWSNGKVGLLGISYYAINQWQVASSEATAPGGDLSLGRRGGLVSGHDPARRDHVHVLPELVRAAGARGPTRARRSRAGEPEHR